VTQGAAPVEAERHRLPFPAPVAPLPTHPAPPPGLRAHPGRDGQVLRYVVRGASTGITAPVRVWLPPGYAAAAAAGLRFPVIEAFPGYPGSALEWFHSMAAPASYDQQVAAHRIRPAVVVSPSVEIPPGYDTECVDGGRAGPQVEQFVTRDLATWVRQHFAVVPARTSWTTLGLSTGGWCAAMVALRHPDEYGAAVVLGGYFRPDFSPGYRPFSPASARGRGYDLVRLEHDRHPPVAIWLQTSHSDSLSYPSSAEFLRAVRSPTSVRAVVLSHAGHRLSVWRAQLGPALDWVGATVPGFAPVPTPAVALPR
jgi:pimeloyl-ACP methyl ester carboxylesterase